MHIASHHITSPHSPTHTSTHTHIHPHSPPPLSPAFQDVLHLLEEIARVQDLREDFNVAVEAGDFKVALDTLTEFRQAVAAARDVACIQSLAADSAGDFDKIEAAMEGVLRDSCKSIDPTQYGRAVYGFKEFGKLPLVRQHMAAFGPEVVAKRARHTVLSYVRAQTEDSKKRKAFRYVTRRVVSFFFLFSLGCCCR